MDFCALSNRIMLPSRYPLPPHRLQDRRTQLLALPFGNDVVRINEEVQRTLRYLLRPEQPFGANIP